MTCQLVDHRGILLRVGQDGHERAVLGRRPHQRRSADVYVLHNLGVSGAGLRHRRLERVQVANHHVDGRYVLFPQRFNVPGVVAHRQEGRVNTRV